MRRSFCVFSRIFGVEDQITIKTYDYLKAIEVFIDSGLENVPIEEMCDTIESMEFDNRDEER